ncbi:MAG: SDR family NAD(P)-dependent oxidoreductase [Burkholderiaceae bacterium]
MAAVGTTKPLAVVTGASAGIGRELAQCFARDGIDLVISARHQEQLAQLASEWSERYGVRVTPIAADLSSAEGAMALADAIDALNLSPTFLVNNAGFGTVGPFAETPLPTHLALASVNMLAPTILTHRLLPSIRQRRGRILNIASTAAFQAGPMMAMYFASKAYLLHWSEAIADELAGQGVTVTALCPGPTNSEFFDRAGMRGTRLANPPTGLATAEAVAAAGYAAMKQGRRMSVHGSANKVMALATRFAPRRLATWIARFIVSAA